MEPQFEFYPHGSLSRLDTQPFYCRILSYILRWLSRYLFAFKYVIIPVIIFISCAFNLEKSSQIEFEISLKAGILALSALALARWWKTCVVKFQEAGVTMTSAIGKTCIEHDAMISGKTKSQ